MSASPKDLTSVVTESTEVGTEKVTETPNTSSQRTSLELNEGIVIAIIGIGFWGAVSVVLLTNKFLS